MSNIEIQSELSRMQIATNKVDAAESKKKMGSSSLDKDSFLRLLVEQMKNQDPLKPQDNSQMISQQAQFTQIETLQNMSKSMESANALSQSSYLIGKTVTIPDPDDPSQAIVGRVTESKVAANEASIKIGDKFYPASSITGVKEAYPN